jgi:hypothetical protein
MADRVTFSGEHLALSEIVEHHQDLESSLRLYFSAKSPDFSIRFAGYSNTEVRDELSERLDESDLSSSFALFTALEAAFRIDYLQRCYRKGRDPLSRVFRRIYREKQEWPSLDDDIFGAWRDNSFVPRRLIGELRGAFRFRHWLAHGRYWTPKLGRKYHFDDVFSLANLTLRSFPFFQI